MDAEKVSRKVLEFIDIVEIVSHMPANEITKNKAEGVKEKLLSILKETKEIITKEVRVIEENG